MYAKGSSVPVAKSKAEIEALIAKAGGTRFATMHEDGRAVTVFELQGRRVMFEIPLPRLEAFAQRKKWNVMRPADPAWQRQAHEQACREKWRALALTVKAKLVSVESGVESFEEAFLAQIIVHGGNGSQRFAEVAIPAIAKSYSGQGLPPLLPSGSR